MLVDGAELINGVGTKSEGNLVWSKTTPIGVSKEQHYSAFIEKLEEGKAIIYKRTQKFAPNWMLTDASNIPVLTFCPAWTPARGNQSPMGPYFAGTLNNIKVYVSPMMSNGEYVLGVKGADLQSAAGVYAVYMAAIPTQLIGLPDGTMQQGFSTMDDMKLLSCYKNNLQDGTAIDAEASDYTTDGTQLYSYLLAKGQITA